MFAISPMCRSCYALKATLISDGTCSRHPLLSGGWCPVTRDRETADQRDDHRTHRQRVDLRCSAALFGRILIVDRPGGRLSVKREGGKPKHSDGGGGWRPLVSGVGVHGSLQMLKGARSAPQRVYRRVPACPNARKPDVDSRSHQSMLTRSCARHFEATSCARLDPAWCQLPCGH